MKTKMSFAPLYLIIEYEIFLASWKPKYCGVEGAVNRKQSSIKKHYCLQLAIDSKFYFESIVNVVLSPLHLVIQYGAF